jgi:hypothetical protein
MSIIEQIRSQLSGKVLAQFDVEIAAAKAPPIQPAIHSYLTGQGFTHKVEEPVHSTTRYVKKGFYDGDFPNAHQSKVTETTHTYTAPDKDLSKHEAAHKHLKKMLGTGTRYKDGKLSHHLKGSHWVVIQSKGGKTTVSHTIRSTKPDHEFERSGRGRGQVI